MNVTDQRVLVVDDNKTNVAVCLHFLKGMGITELETAGDGSEVLEILESGEKFDLILMDLRMPVMDGLTATKEILKRWPSPEDRPRIIAVTAHAFSEESEKCRSAGMDGYLSKPLQRDALVSAMEDLQAAGESTTTGDGTIDFDQFDMVVDAPDSPCVTILQEFFDGLDQMVISIVDSADANLEESINVAHQLKGGSGSFGLRSFHQRMGETELRLREEEDVSWLDSDWQEVTLRVVEDSKQEIEKVRGIAFT